MTPQTRCEMRKAYEDLRYATRITTLFPRPLPVVDAYYLKYASLHAGYSKWFQAKYLSRTNLWASRFSSH
jgi:hypothetical protein